jgi:hypothetical protein
VVCGTESFIQLFLRVGIHRRSGGYKLRELLTTVKPVVVIEISRDKKSCVDPLSPSTSSNMSLKLPTSSGVFKVSLLLPAI